MTTRRRKVEAPNESLSLVHIFYFLFNVFVGAFWRLLKSAYSKQRPAWSNVVVDLLSIGLILTIMGFCKYWNGLIYIGIFLAFIGMVGYWRHSDYKTEGFIEWLGRNHPEDLKLFKGIKPTKTESPENQDVYVPPKVDFNTQQYAKTDKRAIEVDEKELAKWLSKNPDLEIVASPKP